MKFRMTTLSLSFVLLALPGCGSNDSSSNPQLQSEVKVVDGRARATIWENITLDVANPGEVDQSTSMTGKRGTTPEETDAQWDIVMAEDVTIRLVKTPGSPVELMIYRQAYGTLKPGDTVLIDAERTVQVNGVLREPASDKP